MAYHFTLTDGSPLPFTHTVDDANDALTLTVQTTDLNDIGSYDVRANAVWTKRDGTEFTDTWDSFKVEIEGCPCDTSTLLLPEPPMTLPEDITLEIGERKKSTTADLFKDVESILCGHECGAIDYKLVYANSGEDVSESLAKVEVVKGELVVTAHRQSSEFGGTFEVMIQGTTKFTTTPHSVNTPSFTILIKANQKPYLENLPESMTTVLEFCPQLAQQFSAAWS